MLQIVQFNYEDLTNVVRNCLKEAINEIRALPTHKEVDDQIGMEEVKKMIGKCDSWIYQHTMTSCKNPLPYKKLGRKLIFSRKAIKDWIDSNTVTPVSPKDVMTSRLAESAKKKLYR